MVVLVALNRSGIFLAARYLLYLALSLAANLAPEANSIGKKKYKEKKFSGGSCLFIQPPKSSFSDERYFFENRLREIDEKN